MIKYIVSVFILITTLCVDGQNHQYKINDYNNQTISTCSGLFLDDGGQGHWMSGAYNHTDNQDYVTTICNPNLSDSIFLKLYAFKSGVSQPSSGSCPDDRDLLTFYAGTNTSAPCLFSLSGKNVFTYLCGPTNPEFPVLMSNVGCITVAWHSDCSNNAMGWEVGITCQRPEYDYFADASADCDPAQPQASDLCQNAPILPLDQPICGSTSNAFTPETQPNLASWCNNFGASYKSSWISFIADTTFVSFESYVANCTGGTLGMPTGIQMQLFQTADCNTFTQVSNCLSTGALSGTGVPLNLRGGQDGYLFVDNLVPGQRYYMLIGGYYNDVCDYVLVPSNVSPTMALNLISTPDTCAAGNKGTIKATVSGSQIVTPISYNWNPAVGAPSQPFNSNDVNPIMITGLPSGLYTVTATDANGLTATATITVVGVQLVSTIPIITHTSCGHDNGSIVFSTPTSGIAPYSYSIDNGATFSSNQSFINLPSGSYQAIIKDEYRCENSYPIVINPSTGISLAMSSTNETCSLNNGSASVIATGGVPPYNYVWNVVSELTATQINNLNAGHYNVVVTDNSSCTATDGVLLIDSGVVSVQVVTTTAHCGQNDGSVSAICTGQTTNITYTWNTTPVAFTQSISELLAGTYSVVVNNGVCSASSQGVVGDAQGPIADFNYSPQRIKIDEPTVSFINQSSGNYSNVNWQFGDGNNSSEMNPIYNYTNAGQYVVVLTVVDDFGCTDSISKNLIVLPIPTIYIPNAFSPDGDGVNDEFGPKGNNLNPTTYTFSIYNRWGEMVFETTDLNTFWNGKIKNSGEVVPQGVYVYRLFMQLPFEPIYDLVGNVTVVR